MIPGGNVKRLTDVGDATRVAQSILHETVRPVRIRGHDLHLSASIGVACHTVGYDRG